MRVIFAVLIMAGGAQASASTWYYQCRGRIELALEYRGVDPRTPIVSAIFISAEEELLARQTLTKTQTKFNFEYVGRDRIVNGKQIMVKGTCTGWSRLSDSCSYATDGSGNDLICDKDSLGIYISTK